MGGGGEIHIGAEGLREGRYCIGGCDDEEKENLERTKTGTYRFITNFWEESIKNKKSKRFYVSEIKCRS